MNGSNSGRNRQSAGNQQNKGNENPPLRDEPEFAPRDCGQPWSLTLLVVMGGLITILAIFLLEDLLGDHPPLIVWIAFSVALWLLDIVSRFVCRSSNWYRSNPYGSWKYRPKTSSGYTIVALSVLSLVLVLFIVLTKTEIGVKIAGLGWYHTLFEPYVSTPKGNNTLLASGSSSQAVERTDTTVKADETTSDTKTQLYIENEFKKIHQEIHDLEQGGLDAIKKITDGHQSTLITVSRRLNEIDDRIKALEQK